MKDKEIVPWFQRWFGPYVLAMAKWGGWALLFLVAILLVWGLAFGVGFLLGMGIEWLYGKPIIVFDDVTLPWVLGVLCMLFGGGGSSGSAASSRRRR